ncbi:MAG: hypothetical protein WCF90_01955 [Methanomicrobiales archaeon]
MRVWKFGDNINTDVIIPGRFLTIYDPKELSKHAFEVTRDEYEKKVMAGDIVLGGGSQHSSCSVVCPALHSQFGECWRVTFVSKEADTIQDGVKITSISTKV